MKVTGTNSQASLLLNNCFQWKEIRKHLFTTTSITKWLLASFCGLLPLAGCSNDEHVLESQGKTESVKSSTSFTATFDEMTTTRVYLENTSTDKSRKVFWQEGDIISVYSDTDTKLKTYKLASLTNNEATFTGDEVKGNKFYAVFAPNQDCVVDDKDASTIHISRSGKSFTNNDLDIPMVAVSNSNSLMFKQTMGIIRTTVGNVHEISKVVLSGNNGENLGGSGYVNVSENQVEFRLDGKQTTSSYDHDLALKDFEDNFTDIYFPIVPQLFEKGITLNITGKDANGNDFNIEKKYDSRFIVKAGTISCFDAIDVKEELKALEETEDPNQDKANTLVIYYSYTGNCQEIVSSLTSQISADVLRIEPADKTQKYEANNYAIGTQLLNAIKAAPNNVSSYPAIDPVSISLANYDNFIIVTPLWWSQMAAIMQTYLFQHGAELANKHVGLIVSSHSSGISQVVDDAERLVPNANWMGDALWINASNHANRSTLIQNWLSTLNYSNNSKPMTGKINITIDGNTQTITLVENAATQALVERLKQGPVTVTLNNNGDFEIWGSLGFSLPTSNEQINAQPGDVILYNGSNICLFYGSNSWSYTSLGKIDGLSASQLRIFLKAGSNNISVTLSL